jgi:hypothetical protein
VPTKKVNPGIENPKMGQPKRTDDSNQVTPANKDNMGLLSIVGNGMGGGEHKASAAAKRK